jgi:hypothetical protein
MWILCHEEVFIVKIVKAKECQYCGVEVFHDEPYLVFKTKYGDLELIKECKYVHPGGDAAYYLRIKDGQVQSTPTEATKIKRLNNAISMELSQNLSIPV